MSSKSLELRKLMKQKTTSNRKINHSLAKYNHLDQLTCAICGTVIKNEIIWNAHLQSRKHKENINLLKANPKSIPQVQTKSNFKRPTENITTEPVRKKSRSELPKDFFDYSKSLETIKNKDNKPKGILKNKVEQTVTKIPPIPAKGILTSQKEEPMIVDPSVTLKAGLPKDFFDKNITSLENPTSQAESISSAGNKADKEENSKSLSIEPSTSSEELPEGFFDNPKKDAKARNVEYIDPQEKEWEEFQKIIQEETKVAETIREEEDEESEILKDMTEYITMKTCLSRVKDLKSKLCNKSTINNAQNEKYGHLMVDQIKEESDESDEDDIDDLMFDWRSKMV